jgi:hypothetical protein
MPRQSQAAQEPANLKNAVELTPRRKGRKNQEEHRKEEVSGLVRWLRPDYRNPGGTQARQAALVIPTLNPQPSALNARRKLAWPTTLSERVKAVSTELATVKEPVTAG